MPCDSKPLTPTALELQREALERLERNIGRVNGVGLVIGPNGAIAFRGWSEADRAGLADVCAYRKLQARGSAALRQAIARAEVMSGRKVSEQTISAGTHSHDGGRTWGNHDG